jgi:DNA (cytosine-5)-methyltransferase 1
MLLKVNSRRKNRAQTAIPVLTPGREKKRQNGRRFKTDGEAMFTLAAQDVHGVMAWGGAYYNTSPAFGRGFLKGPSRTLKADGKAQAVLVKDASKKGFAIAAAGDGINLKRPGSATRRGRVCKALSPTLETQPHIYTFDGWRIRKITPRECFRLQGFPDKISEKALEVNSDTQLYKQTGNAVTVPVAYEIAKRIPL